MLVGLLVELLSVCGFCPPSARCYMFLCIREEFGGCDVCRWLETNYSCMVAFQLQRTEICLCSRKQPFSLTYSSFNQMVFVELTLLFISKQTFLL